MGLTTLHPDRRALLGIAAVALAAARIGTAHAAAAAPLPPGAHDFDFFFGAWTVAHRRLKARMVGSNDWETFAGKTLCRPLLGGLANYNDSVSYRGGRIARGVGIRSFDPASNRWADWTLSGGDPLHIDAPGIGRFAGNVGTFRSDETFQDRPIKVRGVFTAIRPGLAQWEQAFSADDGATWETNWVMRYTRTRELAPDDGLS